MGRRDWDINCDLGEGEPPSRTASLMRGITSANVACGGHAGDLASMTRCVILAARHGVRLGAHPGPWDRAGFGRAQVRITAAELELLLLQQVGALERLAQAHRIELHHVKLHGGVYHAVEAVPHLARAYLEILRRHWPRCVVYAKAGGNVHQAGSLVRGAKVHGEAFIDRGYTADGGLVARGSTEALLHTRREVQERLMDLCLRGRVITVTGEALALSARTLCIHGDTPAAPSLLRWTRDWLKSH